MEGNPPFIGVYQKSDYSDFVNMIGTSENFHCGSAFSPELIHIGYNPKLVNEKEAPLRFSGKFLGSLFKEYDHEKVWPSLFYRVAISPIENLPDFSQKPDLTIEMERIRQKARGFAMLDWVGSIPEEYMKEHKEEIEEYIKKKNKNPFYIPPKIVKLEKEIDTVIADELRKYGATEQEYIITCCLFNMCQDRGGKQMNKGFLTGIFPPLPSDLLSTLKKCIDSIQKKLTTGLN